MLTSIRPGFPNWAVVLKMPLPAPDIVADPRAVRVTFPAAPVANCSLLALIAPPPMALNVPTTSTVTSPPFPASWVVALTSPLSSVSDGALMFTSCTLPPLV